MKNALLFLFFLSFFSSTNIAQEQYDFDYKIESKAFEKERKFYVHVHEDYYLDTADHFGVVYVLDAQAAAFYNNAKSIIDYLVWSRQIAPMIVVGIHSDNRGREFIPLDRSLAADDKDNRGQAEKLRDHIENEIFPLISKDFRVNDFRALIGHSRGGAFVANTIFGDKKDMFDAYIAISPGMHYLNGQILNDAQEMITNGEEFHKFYYCTYGTVGELEKSFKPKVNFLDSLFRAHPNNTIEWRQKEITGKTHWGVVAPSVADGIIEMNRAYQADQFLIEQFAKVGAISISEMVDLYHSQQKERLGKLFPVPAFKLRYYGNQFQEMGNYENALELYNMAIETDKNETRAYIGMGDTYVTIKEYDKAEKIYNAGLEALESHKSNLSEKEYERKKQWINWSFEYLEKERKK